MKFYFEEESAGARSLLLFAAAAAEGADTEAKLLAEKRRWEVRGDTRSSAENLEDSENIFV